MFNFDRLTFSGQLLLAATCDDAIDAISSSL